MKLGKIIFIVYIWPLVSTFYETDNFLFSWWSRSRNLTMVPHFSNGQRCETNPAIMPIFCYNHIKWKRICLLLRLGSIFWSKIDIKWVLININIGKCFPQLSLLIATRSPSWNFSLSENLKSLSLQDGPREWHYCHTRPILEFQLSWKSEKP